ncbi:hypothetical protein SH611_09335 [Geminicoccaceae bacterium 1502E]|nr:hypothetical protein [Geminicoccaceae bacterium 1502E]
MAQPIRFPVLEIARKTYGSLFHDLPALARAAALWIGFMVLLEALIAFSGFDSEALMQAHMDGLSMTRLLVLGLAAGLLNWLAITAVVVFWHRRILLDEQAPAAMAPLNGRVAAYVWALIKLAVTGGLAAVAGMVCSMPLAAGLMALGHESPLAGALAMAASFLGMMLPIFVVVRLQLILPAAAVNDQAMTLRASWRTTKGSFLRMLLAGLLATLPLMVALVVATGAIMLLLGVGLVVMANAALIVLGFVQAVLLAGLLSHSYRFFKASRPPAAI